MVKPQLAVAMPSTKTVRLASEACCNLDIDWDGATCEGSISSYKFVDVGNLGDNLGCRVFAGSLESIVWILILRLGSVYLQEGESL